MNNYLSTSRSNLENIEDYEEIKIVMGNQACDLDSAISSLTYAYMLNCDIKMKGNILVIPILNIKSEELLYKTEVVYYLNTHQIDTMNLIFSDEIPWIKIKEKLKLVLVDHHVLDPEYSMFWENVEIIIDHRPVNTNQDYSHVKHKTIEPVGSCCSLIARILLSKYIPGIEEIANLLYGTIIFDTVCLKEKAQRTTELDIYVVEEIETKYFTNRVKREDVYNSILKAKTDISAMTTIQIIQKDLKFLNNIPIPTIPMLIQELVYEREDLKESIMEFLILNQCNIMILLGTKFVNDTIKRDLGIYSITEDIKEMFLTELLKKEKELIFYKTVSNITIYEQGNLAMTRKTWIPIFANIFKTLDI